MYKKVITLLKLIKQCWKREKNFDFEWKDNQLMKILINKNI